MRGIFLCLKLLASFCLLHIDYCRTDAAAALNSVVLPVPQQHHQPANSHVEETSSNSTGRQLQRVLVLDVDGTLYSTSNADGIESQIRDRSYDFFKKHLLKAPGNLAF